MDFLKAVTTRLNCMPRVELLQFFLPLKFLMCTYWNKIQKRNTTICNFTNMFCEALFLFTTIHDLSWSERIRWSLEKWCYNLLYSRTAMVFLLSLLLLSVWMTELIYILKYSFLHEEPLFLCCCFPRQFTENAFV